MAPSVSDPQTQMMLLLADSFSKLSTTLGEKGLESKQSGLVLLEIPRNFVHGIFQLWHNFPFLLGRNHKI